MSTPNPQLLAYLNTPAAQALSDADAATATQQPISVGPSATVAPKMPATMPAGSN